jgi:hypothetical protein
MRIIMYPVCLLLGWAIITNSIQAQTRFEWPANDVDLNHYETVEECLAAVARVHDSVVRHDRNWADTMPLTVTLAARTLAAPVIETARRCSAQFDPTQVSLRDWKLFGRLYLSANRDAEAATIVDRRLKKDTATRLEALDTVARLYLTVSPARFDVAIPLVEEVVRGTSMSVWDRGDLLGLTMRVADGLSKRDRQRWAAEQINTLASTLTDADKRTKPFQSFSRVHHDALDFLTKEALLDSLRVGTAGYVTLKRSNWEKASGERGRARNFQIGERAPTLNGNFWFASDAVETEVMGRGPNAPRSVVQMSRPTPGRIALIVFLTNQCRGPEAPHHPKRQNTSCWDVYALLRRLAQQHPSLEITIVTQTYGYFWPIPPLKPAEEAEWISRWWLGFHRIPAALTVTAADFWHLNDPDHRRIDEPTQNHTNYMFGHGNTVINRFAVLTDRDGVIIEAMEIGRDNESVWKQLIEVLESRK